MNLGMIGAGASLERAACGEATECVRRVPRVYRCYQCDKSLDLSQLRGASQTLAQGMARCLAVASLLPHEQRLAPGVRMVSYWHGANRKHRLATYDDVTGVGAIWYRPRLAAVLVIDEGQRTLLASLPSRVERVHLEEVLRSLQPEASGELLQERRLNLPALLSLPVERLRPLSTSAPWRAVQLKSIAWQEAGRLGAENTKEWYGDGWEDYRIQPVAQTPTRIHTVKLRVCPEGHRGYAVQIGPEGETLKVAMSAMLLPAVRALLAL